MLTVVIQVDAPLERAQGIKEDVAAYLERFGDVRVVAIEEAVPEQLTLPGTGKQR